MLRRTKVPVDNNIVSMVVKQENGPEISLVDSKGPIKWRENLFSLLCVWQIGFYEHFGRGC